MLDQHGKGFILLLAAMISLVAMSVDAMLPALVNIADDYQLANPNHAQWTITALFAGLSLGQIVYGPWSDAVGRKPPIYAGYLLFIVGSLICVAAPSFAWLIFGRVLQGMGAASPRIVTMALVRDTLKGAEMAKVMSVVFSVFIVVPIAAPAVGQGIMLFGHWRWIFVMLLLMALVTGLCFWRLQAETLKPESRRPVTASSLKQGLGFVLSQPKAICYTIVSGLVFGGFLGYLNSAAQVFIELYQKPEWFAALFALSAGSVGVASVVNGRLVMRLGMQRMVRRALRGLLGVSVLALAALPTYQGVLPLWLAMVYFLLAFFAIGILFGNLNSMAMEPLGKVAGIGSAFVASISTLVALPIGSMIGQSFNLTLYPLVIGFAACALLSMLLMQSLASKLD